jgi:hypothetical protein
MMVKPTYHNGITFAIMVDACTMMGLQFIGLPSLGEGPDIYHDSSKFSHHGTIESPGPHDGTKTTIMVL